MPIKFNDNGEEHNHLWVNYYDRSEQKCVCGYIRISWHEAQNRRGAWLSYHQLKQTAPPYLELLETKQASHEDDSVKLAELKEKRSQRMTVTKDDFGDNVYIFDESKYLDKPDFPDPDIYNKYIIV